MTKAEGISRGERIRIGLCFLLLACVPAFLFGWLGWLQVLGHGQLPSLESV